MCPVMQHAPRDTGEQAAAMPVHRPIASTAYAPAAEVTTSIKRFQFLDDGPWAKVYLPMDNLSTITQDDITANFQPKSLTVLVRGLQKQTLEFTCTKLHGEIDPDRSAAKLMKTKVLIKLRKVPKPPKEDEDAESEAEAPGSPPELQVEEGTMDAGAAGAELDRAIADLGGPAADIDPASGADDDATASAPAPDLVADTAGGAAGEQGNIDAPAGEDHAAGATAPAAIATPDAAAGADMGAAEDAAEAGATPQPLKEQFAHWYKLRAD